MASASATGAELLDLGVRVFADIHVFFCKRLWQMNAAPALRYPSALEAPWKAPSTEQVHSKSTQGVRCEEDVKAELGLESWIGGV